MGTLGDNLKVVAIVAAIALSAWVVSGEAGRSVGEYLYLKRWSEHWGQRDACIGFYAAYALNKGIQTDHASLEAKCDVDVSDGSFYLGYPDWRWESSKELGQSDPIGTVHTIDR